jgi:hypothetical protein
MSEDESLPTLMAPRPIMRPINATTAAPTAFQRCANRSESAERAVEAALDRIVESTVEVETSTESLRLDALLITNPPNESLVQSEDDLTARGSRYRAPRTTIWMPARTIKNEVQSSFFSVRGCHDSISGLWDASS